MALITCIAVHTNKYVLQATVAHLFPSATELLYDRNVTSTKETEKTFRN